MKTITATDRKTLIRLASTMAVGSPERKAILAGLSKQAKSVGWENLENHFISMGQRVNKDYSIDDAEDDLDKALDEIGDKVESLMKEAQKETNWDIEITGHTEVEGQVPNERGSGMVYLTLEGPTKVDILNEMSFSLDELRRYGAWLKGAARLRGVEAYLLDHVKDLSEEEVRNGTKIHSMVDEVSAEVRDMTTMHYDEGEGEHAREPTWTADSNVPVVDEITVEMDRGWISVSIAAKTTTNIEFDRAFEYR